jgi:hypothetical protein
LLLYIRYPIVETAIQKDRQSAKKFIQMFDFFSFLFKVSLRPLGNSHLLKLETAIEKDPKALRIYPNVLIFSVQFVILCN